MLLVLASHLARLCLSGTRLRWILLPAFAIDEPTDVEDDLIEGAEMILGSSLTALAVFLAQHVVITFEIGCQQVDLQDKDLGGDACRLVCHPCAGTDILKFLSVHQIDEELERH